MKKVSYVCDMCGIENLSVDSMYKVHIVPHQKTDARSSTYDEHVCVNCIREIRGHLSDMKQQAVAPPEHQP